MVVKVGKIAGVGMTMGLSAPPWLPSPTGVSKACRHAPSRTLQAAADAAEVRWQSISVRSSCKQCHVAQGSTHPACPHVHCTLRSVLRAIPSTHVWPWQVCDALSCAQPLWMHGPMYACPTVSCVTCELVVRTSALTHASLQAFVEAPYAAYLMRQHMASSLYDRLSTRPFLTHIEKVGATGGGGAAAGHSPAHVQSGRR